MAIVSLSKFGINKEHAYISKWPMETALMLFSNSYFL